MNRSALLNQRGKSASIMAWLVYGAVCALLGMCLNGWASDWWDANYVNRKSVNLYNSTSATINSGRTVIVMLKALSITPSLPNGDDVRVVYWNGTTNTELARVYNYKTILFKTQANVLANSFTGNDTYWIYWGNNNAATPVDGFATVYDILSDNFNDNSLDTTKWTATASVGGSVTETGQRIAITGVSQQFSGGKLLGKIGYTSTAKRFQCRFTTPSTGSWSIRIGFTWITNPTLNNQWANYVQLYGANAVVVSYTNTNGGTTYTPLNYVSILKENILPATSYRIIYEMLSHSVIMRLYRESSGALIGTVITGKLTYAEMNGAQNQWLNATLYPVIEGFTNDTTSASTMYFDDFGMTSLDVPEMIPYYLNNCGYNHQLFYEESESIVYSVLGSTLYRSSDKCLTTQSVYVFSGDSISAVYVNSGRLFVGLRNCHCIKYSDNQGSTWSTSNITWGGTNGDTAEIRNWGITSTGSYLYVGQYTMEIPSEETAAGNRLYRSSDNGANFTFVQVIGENMRHMHMVRYNAFNGILYATIGDSVKRVFYSNNPDAATPTFTEIAGASPANLGMAFYNSRMLTGGDMGSGNMIKYTNNNSTWNTPLIQGGNYDTQTFDIAYHKLSGIMIATGVGDPSVGTNRIPCLYGSFDGGITWEILFNSTIVLDYGKSYQGFSAPSDTSTRIYLGGYGVPNVTTSAYITTTIYPEYINPPIQPGIDTGINQSILSRRQQ